MDMYVNSVNSAYGAKMYNSKSSDVKKSIPTKSSVKSEAAKVELSEKSSEFQMVKNAVEKQPEIRIEVVEKLKAKIKTNDYPIESNLDEIVKKLIQSRILHE